VREAIRNLESALEGIEAAERRRVAAEEQLRAESIRLEYGESTPFDVLQREEDLVDAESQKILALQLYHTSITALDRAQGTILDNRNIVVEEAAALR
jgi:outer membrane protein TolC